MEKEIILIEPFYTGSHKVMIDLLHKNLPNSMLVHMRAKKWHWRSRTSALYLSLDIPQSPHYKVIFASSVLNLAELVAMRPDLAKLKKVLYFHENQLIYPKRKQKETDFQFGYNQIISCLSADQILFNSNYNMESFLESIPRFLNIMPDYRPKGVADLIRPKCDVMYFPLCFEEEHSALQPDNIAESSSPVPTLAGSSVIMKSADCFDAKPEVAPKPIVTNNQDHSGCCTGYSEATCSVTLEDESQEPLHIVWAHRWEHDKDPDTFLNVMIDLKKTGVNFKLSVMGGQASEDPEIFQEARLVLSDHILNWGFKESKAEYVDVLKSADVAVSTSVHEFFGVAMMEAVYYGCYPLCPNRLVYPELFPKTYLYNTKAQLLKRLRNYCKIPNLVRKHKVMVPVEKYMWKSLASKFLKIFTLK